MKSYLELLQTESILRRLSTIQLLAYFGAWFSNVAIYTLLLNLDVSKSIIAFVAMLHFLSGVLQAPFSGAIIDKFHPKKLMLFLIGIEFFSTLFLVFIQSVEELTFLYILVFLKMAAASFYFTTEMSLLPKILTHKNLQKANELHSMIWSFSYTVGMAVSGFFVYSFGVKAAFIFDAFMFFVAFWLLFGLDMKLVLQKQQAHFLKMMQESVVYLKQNKKVLHLMLLHGIVGFTAFDALVALMVDEFYVGVIATSLALGFLHAFRALGLVIGPMFLAKFMDNKRVVAIFIAQAIAIYVWALVMQNFYLSLAASVLVGFFTTSLWSYTYTLIQTNTDAAYHGRVVAYNDMIFLGTSALSSYGIGFLATHSFSLESITFVLGTMFLFGSIYFFWIVKKFKI